MDSDRNCLALSGNTIDATAAIASTVVLRGKGRLRLERHAVIEDFVVIDFGHSGYGSVTIGARSKLKAGVIVRCYNGNVAIGMRSTIGDHVVVYAHGGVTIGNDVGIGPHCTIAASQHIYEARDIPIRYQGETATGIVVEDDVWVGSGVRVLDGVTIATGCVIGAGAVVTRSTPANHLCLGAPCKPVRRR